MTNYQLACELVERLNRLIAEDENIRDDMHKLFFKRVKCSYKTSQHKFILCTTDVNEHHMTEYRLGPLGLLNGLLESDTHVIALCLKTPDVEYRNWQRDAALQGFCLVKKSEEVDV